MTAPAADTFWRDRPVLITGATGLQGSWLARALLAAQADVIALIRDWVPQSELCRSKLIDSVRVVFGEVTNLEVVERVLGEYEVATVFHLAAQTIVPVANRNPLSTFESNIRGTWITLEACRRSPRLQQIVVASSDKAYGSHSTLPYVEDLPLIGRHPYDVSKSCADLLAQSYAATYELPVVIARCGNLYGGGDLNWSRIVPGTIRSVLRGERPVIRSDGRCIRDYFYVEDAAAAYMAAAQHLAEHPELKGEAFNFSNETPLTVLEIVKRILSVSQREDLAPEIRNDARHEILEQYLDARKARQLLGWQPMCSLEDGLSRTLAWYRDYFQLAEAEDVGAVRD